MIKSFVLSLFCLLSFFYSVAQDSKTIPFAVTSSSTKILNGTVEFNKNVPLDKDIGTLNAGIITKGFLVNPLYEKEGNIYYSFVDFTNNKFAKKYNGNVYFMPKTIFESVASPIYKRGKGFSAGAYSIPFRIRSIGSSNLDIESSLSLQTNLVYGVGSKYKKESWADFSVGIGLTGVNLTSNNSDVKDNRTASAFTISGGALAKASKYANIGLFFGWDFLTQKDRSVNWVYDGKPWIGVGINISFQEVSTGATSTKTEQPNSEKDTNNKPKGSTTTTPATP